MGRRRQARGRAELITRRPPHWAESVARAHLEARGWRTLAANYRLRGGEIDLVMETPPQASGTTVVFVEVKQRASASHGDAAEAIGFRKLAAIRRTANHYLAFELRDADAATRIDAVLVDGDERQHVVRHLEGVS